MESSNHVVLVEMPALHGEYVQIHQQSATYDILVKYMIVTDDSTYRNMYPKGESLPQVN